MYIFRLAARNLFRQLRRSALSTVSIVAGVAVLILGRGFVSGLKENIIRADIDSIDGPRARPSGGLPDDRRPAPGRRVVAGRRRHRRVARREHRRLDPPADVRPAGREGPRRVAGPGVRVRSGDRRGGVPAHRVDGRREDPDHRRRRGAGLGRRRPDPRPPSRGLGDPRDPDPPGRPERARRADRRRPDHPQPGARQPRDPGPDAARRERWSTTARPGPTSCCGSRTGRRDRGRRRPPGEARQPQPT